MDVMVLRPAKNKASCSEGIKVLRSDRKKVYLPGKSIIFRKEKSLCFERKKCCVPKEKVWCCESQPINLIAGHNTVFCVYEGFQLLRLG